MAGLRLVTNSITTQVRLGVVQTTLISPTTQQHPAYDTQTAHHPHHTTFRRGKQTGVAPGHHTSAVPPIVALDHSRDPLYTYCDLSAKHSNSPIHPKAGKLSTPPPGTELWRAVWLCEGATSTLCRSGWARKT